MIVVVKLARNQRDAATNSNLPATPALLMKMKRP
jgi:hypothetical protein